MKSIKTAFVVVVMLVVMYGVWRMINKKPLTPPGGEMAGMGLGELEYSPPGAMSSIAPPSVQGPTEAQPPSQPPGFGQSGAVMPDMRSPAPPLADQHAMQDRGAHQYTAQDQHAGGADLTQPQGAPVVGPDEYAGSSSFTAGRPATDPPQSVYNTSPAPVENSAGADAHESGPAALANTGFQMTWEKVQRQLADGQLAEALGELSVWYGSSDVPADLQPEMLDLLDQLAGTVIYSPQHLIEQPYQVRSGETIQDIARKYQVPWQLLANINGIANPQELQPGAQLKVVRGPFNALVSLQRQELTLIVDGRYYAGRFPISLGNDPAPLAGEYTVREKAKEKEFIDREGRTIPPGDDANPYGPYWIGLDGQLGIHGAAPPPKSGQRASTGSIIVSPEDARDLFAILSQDSRVVIRR